MTTFFAHSINNPIKFEHISTEQGLSQSYVFSIAQDQRGFIWVATQDGLNRYDGKYFKQYRHNNSDPFSIANNYITKVFVDDTGVLWVGTKNGLSRYNEQLDRFDNFYANAVDPNSLLDNVIWTIYQDNNSDLWVSTANGLHIFNSKSATFSPLIIKNGETQFLEVKTIFQDDDKNYWIGTYEHGIFVINENKSYAQSLQKENRWQLVIKANALYEMKLIDKNYWLATDNGVFVVNHNYEIIKHYQEQQKPSLLSNHVRTLLQVDDSHVWLGTYQNGLNIINLLDDSITAITSDSYPKAISEDWIMTLFKDRQNKIWLGTLGKGLNVYKTSPNIFHHQLYNLNKDVTSFTLSPNNELWFSTSNSIERLTNKGTLKTLPVHFDTDMLISRIIVTEKGELLVFLDNGKLFNVNPETNQTQEYQNWFVDVANDKNQNKHYENNTLWYIDKNGNLSKYDLVSNNSVPFILNSTIRFTQISKSYHGQLWLTTDNGKIFNFDINDKSFTELNITLTDTSYFDSMSAILPTKNWLWIGSEQGVIRVNKQDGQVNLFSENNGLSNNYINSILTDDDENAWIATNKGISYISAKTGNIINFNKDYALSDNDFLKGSALRDAENNFYFGGLNGYQKFDPREALQIKQSINQPVITDLLVANKQVNIQIKSTDKAQAKKFSISENVNNLDTLTLAYSQSPFSLEFVSPNLLLTEQTRYRYKLDGLENSWIESGVGNYRATYTNLDSGDYLFQVQAYDLHDATLFKSKQLKIHILPPWWLSHIAIALYSLVVLLIIGYLLLQMHHRRQFHLQIQQSEERLKLSLWGSGDEMWDWNIKSGKIYRSNIWGLLEFPQDGTRNGDREQTERNTNIHPQDLPRVQESLREHFRGNTDYFEETYRVKSKQGAWVWVLDRGKVVDRDENKQALRMTGTLKDISLIKKAEERLKLFAKSIENISDAVAIYDKEFNAVEVNKAYIKITGKNKKQAIGKPFEFSQYPESYTDSVKKQIQHNGAWHGEIENQRANGEIYLTDVNIDIIRDEDQEISHYVSVFSDITERKKNEEELRKLANSDTLTGLPNRSFFQAKQSHLVNYKIPHALLVFDLDNFKKINDSLGHEVGDALLCRVADRIVNTARNQDTICRLGGDEFSLLIENTNDIYTITTIAKSILRKIAEPLRLTNQEVVLYSSIGIVLYPDDGSSPQELLKNADTAMYHAKNLGGNRYQFFNDSMNKEAVKRLQVENLIRYGLKEDYFAVFYQPKIEIATGKIAGMEALVRFEHPRKGIISPAVFIPVSEDTGQIIGIGEVVLRKACFATKRWVDEGLFSGRVAVNLSAVQFTQPNLVELIASILQESRLPAKYLELEITEGTVMNSPQTAIDIMLQIRAMGIHLSLDDFGTGYSSLAYLKKFPLNTLKIDKAFVDDIEHSEQGRNMVATIVTIAHNLGLQVVAEGVEHSKQLDFLATLHCEQLQGFLYSKPLSVKDFKQYLVSKRITEKSTNFSTI